MSYSSKLKEEILSKDISERDEVLAELFGIFISRNSFKNSGIEFSTESFLLANRIYKNIIKHRHVRWFIVFSSAPHPVPSSL